MTIERAAKYQTLTQALEELERTDPAVRKAAENYERTKQWILDRRERRMAVETPVSLTRKRSVLDRVDHDETTDKRIVFSGEDAGAALSQETWADMGKPDQLTVAIWPGDRQDLMEADDFPE